MRAHTHTHMSHANTHTHTVQVSLLTVVLYKRLSEIQFDIHNAIFFPFHDKTQTSSKFFFPSEFEARNSSNRVSSVLTHTISQTRLIRKWWSALALSSRKFPAGKNKSPKIVAIERISVGTLRTPFRTTFRLKCPKISQQNKNGLALCL